MEAALIIDREVTMREVSLQLTAIIVVAVLVLVAITGIIVYFNEKISNLNSQVSNLKTQIEYLTSANLTATISTTELPYPTRTLNGTLYPNYMLEHPTLYNLFNDLYLNGSVINNGGGAAFSAGLHVLAYAANGTVEVNMTVPLVNGEWVYGTDATTDAYASNYYKNYLGSLQLGYLKSGQTVTFDSSFYHEDTVTNWTATPVWSNKP